MNSGFILCKMSTPEAKIFFEQTALKKTVYLQRAGKSSMVMAEQAVQLANVQNAGDERQIEK